MIFRLKFYPRDSDRSKTTNRNQVLIKKKKKTHLDRRASSVREYHVRYTVLFTEPAT